MLFTFLLALTSTTPTINHKVKVDGKTYRVEVKGRTVEVFDKSVFTKRNPEAGDRLRRAARLATGCELKDEYWETAHLVGLLDCSTRVTPQADPSRGQQKPADQSQ